MNDKIRNHVEILFAAAPKTVRAAEMKEELLVNLNEKYDDLLRGGYDSTTAFHIALSGIGDLDELFRECALPQSKKSESKPLVAVNIETAPAVMPIYAPPKSSRTPLYLGLAFALTVLGPAFVPLFAINGDPGMGIMCMFLCWAVGGGFFFYAIASAFSKSSSRDEEFYQRQLLAQGTNYGLTREYVQHELQRLGRMNRLRRIILILVALLLAFLLYRVATLPGGFVNWNGISWGIFDVDTLPATGPIVSEAREIGDFTKLEVSSAIHVEYKTSDRNALSVETHEDVMPHIITEVRDGTLSIRQNPAMRFRNVRKLFVAVSSPTVPREFAVSGASRLVCDEPLQTDAMSLRVSGASKQRLKEISCEKLEIKLDGASTLDVSGKVGTASIAINGASGLRATSLEIDRCDIESKGASHADLGKIAEELSAGASGASRIYYQGSPTVKKQYTAGASRIIPR